MTKISSGTTQNLVAQNLCTVGAEVIPEFLAGVTDFTDPLWHQIKRLHTKNFIKSTPNYNPSI
jgi:hypothetical protein